MIRRLRFGQRRLLATFDLYNLFNPNTILSENGTFGPTWRQPTEILAARLLKLGVQFDF